MTRVIHHTLSCHIDSGTGRDTMHHAMPEVIAALLKLFYSENESQSSVGKPISDRSMTTANHAYCTHLILKEPLNGRHAIFRHSPDHQLASTSTIHATNSLFICSLINVRLVGKRCVAQTRVPATLMNILTNKNIAKRLLLIPQFVYSNTDKNCETQVTEKTTIFNRYGISFPVFTLC